MSNGFEYKTGDMIVRDKAFYEPNHMMIVYDVRPSMNEFVVSHLTYGGLQLYTFHREQSSVYPSKAGANQKVIRWKGSKHVIQLVLQILNRLHDDAYQIDFSRWETVKSLFYSCKNQKPDRLHDRFTFKTLFDNSQLFCSSYVSLVWKYALEEAGVPDEAFPMNVFYCHPDEIFTILKDIPKYWETFYVKTSKKGRVRELEFGKSRHRKSRRKRSVRKSKNNKIK